MRQKWKALGICCLVLCLLVQSFLFSATAVYAAQSASISFSSNTVKVGDTVTATVKFSGGGIAMGAVEAELTYDSKVLTFVSGENAHEYAAGKIAMAAWTTSTTGASEFAFTLTFRAKAAGSATLSAATTEFVPMEGDPVSNVSKNASLTVRAISTDASLKALSVNNGTLSPKFATGTTSYTVSVANSVSSIKVSATATDANAKVTGTGTKTLSVGKNTINIKVTAEDGKTTKTYTITVTRAAATPTPTKSPTKEPTKSPTKSPTSAPVTTTPPATTAVPTETAPAQTTPAETTPGETIQPTPGETTSSVETPTNAETPTQTATPANTSDAATPFSGLFTIQTAFVFCAVGMFLVGAAVGFIVCYGVKSKKR